MSWFSGLGARELKPTVVLPVAVAVASIAAGGVWVVMTSGPSAEELARVSAMQPVALVRAPMVRAPRFVEGDTASIAREIQKELNRVGCYDGAINGIWSPRTRQAMREFVDGVNAKLPVDKPDEVLLSLVMGQADRVCGDADTNTVEASVQAATLSDAEQVVSVVTAPQASDGTGSQEQPEPHAQNNMAGATALAAAGAPATVLPMRRETPSKSQPLEILQGSSEPMVSTARVVAPDAGARQDEQSQSRADVQPTKYKKRTRRSAKYKYKTPKYMRSFVRSVKGTLASFGIR